MIQSTLLNTLNAVTKTIHSTKIIYHQKTVNVAEIILTIFLAVRQLCFSSEKLWICC